MKKQHALLGVLLAAATLVAGSASAAPILPTSYDMLNGNGEAASGSFNYWDLSYSGAGSTNVDNAPLTGGLGDLTDGVIPVLNWLDVENDAGTGPYVGWRTTHVPQPTVTFRFGSSILLDAVTLSVDDSGGAGGVQPPSSVDIGVEGGPYTNFAVTDPAGFDPFSFTLSGLGLTGSAFDIVFHYTNEWLFVSEVTFDGTPTAVPEPTSLALVGAGLFAGLLSRRFPRRRRA